MVYNATVSDDFLSRCLDGLLVVWSKWRASEDRETRHVAF